VNSVYYKSPGDYLKHYIKKYVNKKIVTFDGLIVKFTIDQFNHAFYNASIPNVTYKDLFDTDRAERIDWIEYALNSGYAEVYIKNDNIKRRLHILLDNYVIVLNITGRVKQQAFFITAYVADSVEHINKLKTNHLIYKPK